MVGGGGGASVMAADACASRGFSLPPIPSEVSREMRTGLDSDAGLILTNPIELNLSPEVTYKMGKTMLEYEGFDLMLANCVFGQHPWSFFDMWFDMFCDTVLKVHAQAAKPMAVILDSGLTKYEQHFAAREAEVRRGTFARLLLHVGCLPGDRPVHALPRGAFCCQQVGGGP